MKKTIEVMGYYPKEELTQGIHDAALPKNMRFNMGDHIVLKATGSEMATVVLDTQFGLFTVCVIPWEDGSTGGCLDIQYKGDQFEQQMIGFTPPSDQHIKGANLYSLDLRKAEPKPELPDESALECVQRLVSVAREERQMRKRFEEHLLSKDEATRVHWKKVVDKHRSSEVFYMRMAKALANDHGIDMKQFTEGK